MSDDKCPVCGEPRTGYGNDKEWTCGRYLGVGGSDPCGRAEEVAIKRGKRIEELERALRIIETWARVNSESNREPDRLRLELQQIADKAMEVLYKEREVGNE